MNKGIAYRIERTRAYLAGQSQGYRHFELQRIQLALSGYVGEPPQRRIIGG